MSYLAGKKALSDLHIDKQVSTLDETIMKIFENFIPHETITCNGKNPPWMKKQIKSLIVEKTPSVIVPSEKC